MRAQRGREECFQRVEDATVSQAREECFQRVAREEDAKHAGEIAGSIIDGLQAALLVHRDGTLLHVNPFAATLLGYQSSEDALKAENLKRVFGV